MKINQKCVQNMYKIPASIIILLLIAGCAQPDPEIKRVLVEEYPPLYEAVFARDGEMLLEFVDHPDSIIRAQAWSALIQTPVEDTDLHLQKVMQYNSEQAWASLWLKELTAKQVDYLNSLWEENPGLRPGLLSVYAEQGNEETLNMLLEYEIPDEFEYEHALAFAIGSISRTVDLSLDQQLQIIQQALASSDSRITQAYLYGMYRARKELHPDAKTELIALWDNYYPEGIEGDQFIARILMPTDLDMVLRHFAIERYQTMDVQLAIELAQGIAAHGPSEYSTVILNALLDHRNPNVIIAALQAIQRNEDVQERLFRDIMNKVGLMEYQEPLTRLEALNTINDPARYQQVVFEVAGNDPYLQSGKYEVIRKFYSENDFYNLLVRDLDTESRLNKFYAIQELGNWWPNVSEAFKQEKGEEAKELIINLLEEVDRSMIFVMSPLFMEPSVIGDDDYPIFERMLARFELPEDVEVYQSVSQVLYARFEEQALQLIDSLAMQGNVALNRTLISQGWDILQGNYYPEAFRTPDWNRLAKITTNPYLVIELDKGEIIIKLDVLSAPATIAGMDSLLKAGAYDWVPFHRVVPNFVIQGGDVETQDGFGGPGYVVPTEASSNHYNRAMVGIASAGTDTEGSQFFVMHQWKPHLNGRYTIIGEVVEGMDVVDRVVPGNKVIDMYWYR